MRAGPGEWRSPGPLVLLADTEALSRSVGQLAPTRGSTGLSLTSGGLLDRSDFQILSLQSPYEFGILFKKEIQKSS